jgi:hypothetical protein
MIHITTTVATIPAIRRTKSTNVSCFMVLGGNFLGSFYFYKQGPHGGIR